MATPQPAPGRENVRLFKIKSLRHGYTPALQNELPAARRRLTDRGTAALKPIPGKRVTVFDSGDEAARRRLNMVPFTITVPVEARDKQLTQRLLTERDGILAWAIEGCLEWQRIGLAPPPAVVRATEEYFTQEDAVGRWLEECCTCNNASDVTSVTDLFQCWTAWAKISNEFQGSKKRFSITLEERGFKKAHGMKGSSFQGIRLSEEGLAFVAQRLNL